jgi:hypothetical protein
VIDSAKQQLLRKVAERIGRRELAVRLQVPESLLEAWISGHASMPDRKFLALADFLDEISNPPK